MVDVVPLEKVFIDYGEMVVIGHPAVIRRFKVQLQEATQVANICNAGW